MEEVSFKGENVEFYYAYGQIKESFINRYFEGLLHLKQHRTLLRLYTIRSLVVRIPAVSFDAETAPSPHGFAHYPLISTGVRAEVSLGELGLGRTQVVGRTVVHLPLPIDKRSFSNH